MLVMKTDFASLMCAVQNLGWDKYLPGEEKAVTITTKLNITDKHKYGLDTNLERNGYRLLVYYVTLQDAGRYRCIYLPLPTLYREAEFIVLGEPYNQYISYTTFRLDFYNVYL